MITEPSIHSKYTEGQVKDWHRHYLDGMTLKEVSERTGISIYHIKNEFKKRGMKVFTRGKRASRVSNETAFQGQLSSEALYWLGFILADGCILSPNGYPATLSITLKRDDKTHLSKLSKFLQAENQPKDYDASTGHPCSMLWITNDKIIEGLVAYGVNPRKTYDMVVDKRLQYSRDFWRGMVDGNGHLLIKSGGYPVIALTGTEAVCESFRKYCLNVCPDTQSRVRPQGPASYRYYLSGKFAVSVMDSLYAESDVYLDRKYDLYSKIKELTS